MKILALLLLALSSHSAFAAPLKYSDFRVWKTLDPERKRSVVSGVMLERQSLGKSIIPLEKTINCVDDTFKGTPEQFAKEFTIEVAIAGCSVMGQGE